MREKRCNDQKDDFYIVMLKKIPLNWMKYILVIIEPSYFIVSVRMPRRNVIIVIAITRAIITVN